MTYAGNVRFRAYVKNVTAEAITEGRHEYALLGADPIAKRLRVDKRNVFGRVYLYSLISNARVQHRMNFEKMLLRMLQSGRYYADASWCLSPYGNGGMHRVKAAAAYRLYTAPKQFREAHLMSLFFAGNDRWPTWATQRWEDEVMKEDIAMPTAEEEAVYLRQSASAMQDTMPTNVDVCIHQASVADRG